MRPSSRAAYVFATLGAIVLGLVLRRDLLWAGFFADDFDHYAMLTGHYPVPRSPLDLFNFGDGSTAENAALMEAGHFPWWSAPDVHLSMFRPLASALIAFDFATFGFDARFFHAHSFLWWVLLIASASWLLVNVLPRSLAALALVLYVCEEGHSLPLGWLANRSPLVATTFGFLALGAHVRARREGKPKLRLLSWFAMLLSLAAGEYAFSVLAYFVAWEVFDGAGAPARKRLLALAPFAGLAVAYLIVRHSLGVGIDHSGFYLSPTSAPASFALALAWRLPVFLADLVLGIPADWYLQGSPWRDVVLRGEWFSRAQWQALPSWQAVHVGFGVLAIVLSSAMLVVVTRSRALAATPDSQRAVRWLFFGALLALVPVAGSMSSARLTVAASLGIDVLLAACVLRAFTYASSAHATGIFLRAGAALAAIAVLYLHVVTAGQRSHGESQFIRARSYFENAWVLAAELDEARVADQQLVIVNARDLTSSWYLPYVRHLVGLPMPRGYWLLSGASQPHDLVRVADDSFELSVLTTLVDKMAVGSNYRPAYRPFRVGDEVALAGFRARVTATLDGQPRRVRFTFAASLDDPRYVFLASTPRGLRKLALPKVGERVRLPRPTYPHPAALEAAYLDLGAPPAWLLPEGVKRAP